MNAASNEPKVAAMAAVLTELVAQRRAMHARMDAMERPTPGARGRMMPHAGAGH
ncbi:hypothetical protein D3C83_142880 [compost metagenome]